MLTLIVNAILTMCNYSCNSCNDMLNCKQEIKEVSLILVLSNSAIFVININTFR